MPGFRIANVGASTSSQVRPRYKYTWEVPTIFGDPAQSGSLVYIKEAQLPNWDFDVIEIPGAAVKYKFAGHVNFGEIRLTWYDVDGTHDRVKAWRDRIWTPEDGIKPANDYKTESIIRSLAYDIETRTDWKLVNSWPKSVQLGELTYSDSDINSVVVSLVYDWAEIV